MDPVISLQVSGSEDGIRAARVSLDSFAAENGLDREVVWPFQVALDEVLSNLARHARRPPAAPARVEVCLRLAGGSLEMVLEDDAPAFNPLLAPAPDTTSQLEERRPGGLGITLVRQLMDVMEYTRTGDHNRLLLRRGVAPGRARA